jgi:HK97 family phage major capsid protein
VAKDLTVEGMKARVDAADARVKELEADKARMIAAGAFGGTSGGDSDEKRALRFFGCSHAKELIHVNVGHPRFAKVPQEVKHTVLELKRSVDVARMVAQMFHGEAQDAIGATEQTDRVARVKGMLDTNYGRNVLAPRLKAFGSTVSGGGDEWVPTLLSSQYIEEFELDWVVEQRVRAMNMPSNPYQLPVQTGVTKARQATENTAMTSSNFGTSALTFNAKKIAEHFVLPEELNEDSAPDILGLARDELVKAQTRAVESAMINGDDDGTHIDSDTQALAADVAEKLWKGWRRQALANSANGGTVAFGGAGPTEANINKMRTQMKKFGVDSTALMLVAGPSVYQQLFQLPSVITVDKMGPLATVLKGALGAYQAIPIVVSQYMREDLNATGVYDGTTTTRAGLLLVHAARWYIGVRRPIRVKIMADLPSQDRWLMASYQRKDFIGQPQSATETSVVYGYNILT